jgi:hypothetical protein
MSILLDHLLDFLHLLIEHLEKLRILFVFDFHLVELLLALEQLLFQSEVLSGTVIVFSILGRIIRFVYLIGVIWRVESYA